MRPKIITPCPCTHSPATESLPNTMSFQFKLSQSVQANVRRIAVKQIDNAIRESGDPNLDQAVMVHEVRKRCKKLRGLIRLVGPALGKAYTRENTQLRDAARRLSSTRDAQVMLETHDGLLGSPDAAARVTDYSSIGQQLRSRLVETSAVDIAQRLSDFRSDMLSARSRPDTWQLRGKGFHAISGGLQKTHHRARKALDDALKHPSSESLHQLRKQTKYHGYHIRLLRPLWSERLVQYGNQFDRLGELLGDEHNLQTLRATLLQSPEAFGSRDDLQAYIVLLDKRSEKLQRRALLLARRLFAEPSGAFAERMNSYWKLRQ